MKTTRGERLAAHVHCVSKCETAAERSWVLADSVDWSWLSKASHSDSSSVNFETIRMGVSPLD